MKASMINVCVIRGPGTNCDQETMQALKHFGVNVEVVHMNRFIRGSKDLEAYQGLVVPGGFSFGDHIRSGAIMGKMLKERFGAPLERFAEEGKPILGICNGFQVLVESGLLPGINGIHEQSRAALATNTSSKYEDRWIYLKNINEKKCIFTRGLKKITRMPVAHAEGKFTLPLGEEAKQLENLQENDQLVLCYAKEDGTLANGKYPENPNGSIADIAGICNPTGTIFGLMPHPERAFHRITYPDWTRTGLKGKGDGFWIFKNMVEHIEKMF